jgi:hypothetical protein
MGSIWVYICMDLPSSRPSLLLNLYFSVVKSSFRNIGTLVLGYKLRVKIY